MRILDLSAGNRAIWFEKDLPFVTFLDKRESVNPTFVCDTRSIPDEVGKDFNLVVFDPPHVNFGASADMSKAYGHHTSADIRDIVARSSDEAHRISKPNALMAFKWNDHDQKLEKILALMPKWKPLFGHKVSSRTKHSSMTYWVMLISR